MSQIVQLSLLSEKEEEAILSVIEEDLELQKEEERRIKKLRDDIASGLTLKCRNYAGTNARTFCACCGVMFGWIFDSGKMCPTCSQWVCKRDRINCSYKTHQWICKLCHIRMELYINEQMLNVSIDPSNVLCVSFNARDGKMEQGFHYKQQKCLQPKEETEQDYHNQEMLQQEMGEESEEGNGNEEDTEEEQLQQQNIHTENNLELTAVSLALSSNNTQGTCQHDWQDTQKEKGTEQTPQQQSIKEHEEQKTTRNAVFSSNDKQLQENHSVPIPQDHPHPVTTCTPTRSPKRLSFSEKVTITQSFLQPIIPVATVKSLNPINILDDDNDDNGAVDDVTRSSSEDGDETSDDDDDNYCTSSQLKPILVYPNSNDDGEETINLMFPKKREKTKASFALDDVDFRALTKQNTRRNRVSVTSLKSSDSHDDTSHSTDYGQLKVSLQFNITNDKKKKGDLVVTIINGHNLLQTELVVKCHLLPDNKKKFKTKVLKDNSNPEWNEQFVFDHIKLEDLRKNRVIELTVWNSTKYTKHYDFIGGVRLGPRPHHKKQLSYMDSSENELSHWMSVVNTPGECVEQLHTLRHNMDPLHMGVTSQQEVTSQHSLKTTCKTPPSDDGLDSDSDNNRMAVCSRQLVDTPVHIGEVRVMLQYVSETNKSRKEKCNGSYLKVWIRQASGLKTRYNNGSFVLCTLLPKGKHQKVKSPVIENDENSVYNTKFRFEKVTDVELSYDRVLEITIWEPHRNTNELVGGIRLGPKPQPGNKNKWMDCVGSEVSQWEVMMARPKEWIDQWHLLRLLNKPQKV